MSSMSKLSLNNNNTFEKSREQLLLNTNSNLNTSGAQGTGNLNFYTQQMQNQNDVSPKANLDNTHDLSASLIGGLGGTSAGYHRRDTNLHL